MSDLEQFRQLGVRQRWMTSVVIPLSIVPFMVAAIAGVPINLLMVVILISQVLLIAILLPLLIKREALVKEALTRTNSESFAILVDALQLKTSMVKNYIPKSLQKVLTALREQIERLPSLSLDELTELYLAQIISRLSTKRLTDCAVLRETFHASLRLLGDRGTSPKAAETLYKLSSRRWPTALHLALIEDLQFALEGYRKRGLLENGNLLY